MTDKDVLSTTADTDVAAELARLEAENKALRSRLSSAAKEEAPPNTGWRRRWISITCAVLGAILLPVAVLTVWARDTLLNTDDYVATVAPLVEDENIQEAISFRVTEVVAEEADFKGIAEAALPPEGQVLAGPIEAGAKTVVTNVVQGLVATDAFGRFWEESNRTAHASLVPLLTGEENDAVSTQDGRIALLVGPLAAQALEGVDDELGTDLSSQIPAEALEAEVVLVESEDLAEAQGLVRLFDSLSWIWLILALAFLAGTVFFAERRRSGVRRLGFAVAVPMVVTLLAFAFARDQYLNGLPDEVHNPDAAAAVFDVLTNYLRRALRMLLVVGLLILFGAWVVGPSDAAAKVRGGWDTLLGRASTTGSDRPAGPLAIAAATHEQGLMTGAAVLGALTLVVWTRPTGLVVLMIVAVTLAVMAGVRILAEIARRSEENLVTRAVDVRDSNPST
ncbi:MAG: hypothetical protein ACN4GZ_14215 [Acidimicrobiales bacterium]